MKSKTFSLIKFLIGWPLSFAALFFIGRLIWQQFPKIELNIFHANFFLILLGILAFILYFAFRSLFWQKLLAISGHTIPFLKSSLLFSISELKRYIPGNLWSILDRTTQFEKHGVLRKSTAHLWLVESEFFLVSGLVLSLFSVSFVVFGIFPYLPFKHVLVIAIPIIATAFAFLFLSGSLRIFPKFPFTKNLSLFFTMSLSLFFFGLGTYLSISAIAMLYPPHVLGFISFFIFSMIVGYISFITPMGLGVREGVIAIGVSRYLSSLTLAAAGALFARIVFIASEVLFLFLLWLFVSLEQAKHLMPLQRLIKKYTHEIFLCLSIICYSLYFTLASFARFANFYTGRFDLGNMDQTVWNTIHGNFFQLTNPNGTDIISRLAFHADYILIVLSPLYLFWQDPRMLLLIQTLILSFGALFVYLIAKNVLHKKSFALLFAILYIINPSINHSNLYDFHGVVLATTFLLGAGYFLIKRKWAWMLLFLALAAVTKEEVWLVTAMLGIFICIKQKKYSELILGIGIFLFSLFVFWFFVFHAIPFIRGSQHFALSYYSDLGMSPGSILKTIFLSPLSTFLIVMQPRKLLYLLELFAPLGFLSYFSPLFLLFAIPELGINLLSNNAQLHQIYYQYTAVITPFLFLSAIYGTKTFLKKFPKISEKSILQYLVCTGILTAYLFGPLPGALNANLDMFGKPQPDREVIQKFLENIPKNLSVAATNNIGSHLSHRQKIFTIPTGIDQADVVVFLLNDKFAQPSLAEQRHIADNMKHDKNYVEIFRKGDFIVFEKRNLYAHPEPNTQSLKLFPVAIAALETRDFAGGQISTQKLSSTSKLFSSYIVSYPSDGLKLFALMNVPNGKKPINGFPVVIVNRGSTNSTTFSTENTYKAVADYFATQGFLVLKPDFRGIGNSEKDGSTFGVLSYPIDDLNLLSSLKSLQNADTSNVFLWGHAIGGGVTLATLEAHDQNDDTESTIRGASVWAPAIDPYATYTRLKAILPNPPIPYTGAFTTLGTYQHNALLWQSISPIFYADDITTPLEIVQGTGDIIIPYQWSIELYDDLVTFNRQATLILYPNDDHGLSKNAASALLENARFFKSLIQQ